jgi:uncharacterized membrane protein
MSDRTSIRTDGKTDRDDAAEGAGQVIDTDVLVIGGGPAGSTAATLLARRGWKVTLLERRATAWLTLACVAIALAGLLYSGHALVPLLLVPVAIIGLVGYAFARTLRTVPLITRMVAGLDGVDATALSPELIGYTRNLTRAWAVLLLALALANLLLALLAVPDGLLASYGIASPWPLDPVHWSWFAGVFNLGLMIGFFLVEFAVRQRRFPGRYRNVLDFLQRMARLGPEFWRDVAH